MKRVAYIDGANLHNGAKDLGWRLDYRRFYIWLTEKFNLTEAHLFIGHISGYETMYEKMSRAGFILNFKETVRHKDGSIKGNCDAELIVAAITCHFDEGIDFFVLVSSDGDFAPLARFFLQERAKVAIVSPHHSCSAFLLRLNVPVTYLRDLKNRAGCEP